MVYNVTPHMGVWIETLWVYKIEVKNMSRPTWACGLKLNIKAIKWNRQASRPTWACGLKLYFFSHFLNLSMVTPHMGVWIETLTVLPMASRVSSRPTWACGLKP